MSDERTSFCLRPNTQIYSGLSVVLSLTLVPPITVSTRILSLGMSPLVILTAEARLVQRIMSTPGNVFKGFSFWLQIDPSTAFSNKSRVRLARSVALMIFSFCNETIAGCGNCVAKRIISSNAENPGNEAESICRWRSRDRFDHTICWTRFADLSSCTPSCGEAMCLSILQATRT